MDSSREAPRVVDLFSGAGGLSLGFHAAGSQIVAALDLDEQAGETFTKNFGQLQAASAPIALFGPHDGDISRTNLEALGRRIGKIDILIGGPPCQGFSRIGRAKLNSLSDEGFEGDHRNELYRRFLEAAETWRPGAVLMENVPGMLSVGGENIAEGAAADLARRGYEVGYAVLNAIWYGVPQFRERFFLIGLRDDLGIKPEIPVPTHRAELPSGYRRPSVCDTIPMSFLKHRALPVAIEAARIPAATVREALEDLPPLRDHTVFDVSPARGEFRVPRELDQPPASSYAILMRDWPGFPPAATIDDHVIRCTPRDYETFRRMKPGDRYPEARQIMKERLQERLTQLASSPDGTPKEGTTRYISTVREIVAPYPVDKFVDKWRKLIPDAPSWTVPAHLAKDSYSHIHYDDTQARTISVREAARLQSFPDAFRFAGNLGECFRQIGNAVPPLLAWAIASHLLHQLGFSARQVG